MSLRSLVLASVFVIVCLSGASCNEDDRFWNGRVRVFNTIPDADYITVSINGSEETRLFFGEFSDYQRFDSRDATDLRVFVPGGSVPIFQGPITVSAQTDRTVAVTGPKNLEGAQQRYVVSLVSLIDTHDPEIPNSSAVRFVNLSPSAGIVDISFNRSNATSTEVLPRFERLQYRVSTGYLQAVETVEDSVITIEEADSGEVLYRSPKLDLDSRQVVTYYILDRSDRGLPVEVVTMVDSDF